MIRDTLKNKNYFEKYIAYEKSRINKFTEIGKNISPEDTNRYSQCMRYIASFKRNLISAMYSAGYSKFDLDKEVRSYLYLINEIGSSSYSENIDVLSLVVLFNISREEINGIIEFSAYEDALTSTLKANIFVSGNNNISSEMLLYKEKYYPFVQYLNGELDVQAFREYLESSWYESNRDSYWFDSHKSQSDTYAGYWCWLAAATLKIKKTPLEYSSIKYVPYELI